MPTKRDLVKTIAERAALPQAQTAEVVQLTLEAIVEAAVEHGRLELRNFGVFEVKHRAPRKARHPVTGKTMDVPARDVLTFRPSPAVEAQVAAREE